MKKVRLQRSCLATCLVLTAMAMTPSLSQDGSHSTSTPAPPADQRGSIHRQNFNFSNMEIRSAFKGLSATGRVDIVVSPNVIGQNVNLQLTDKTWQEALLILCQCTV